MSYLASSHSPHALLLTLEPYISRDSAGEADDVSSELRHVVRELVEARAHFERPTSRQRPNLAAEFDRLTALWRDDTLALSSATEIAMHPAYQRIIGMGWAAVPLILRQLRNGADHWFWALKAITGVDPVPQDRRGRMAEMRLAWLVWAEANGIE